MTEWDQMLKKNLNEIRQILNGILSYKKINLDNEKESEFDGEL